MKQLIFLAVLFLLAVMQSCTHPPIVTMTTANDSVTISVEWTGTGSITANGVKLKNDFNVENMIEAAASGSVVLAVTGEAQLTHLRCTDNALSALDIINCPKLKELYCNLNLLTALDVTNCPELTKLHCRYNALTTLDVTNCPELTELSCNKSLISALDITNCPKLAMPTDSENSSQMLGVDITRLLSFEQFERIKKFVLEQGQTMTYCSMYNNNPYYKFGSIELFLNPIMQFPNSSSISDPDTYNVIMLRMWNPPQDYQFLYTDIIADKNTKKVYLSPDGREAEESMQLRYRTIGKYLKEIISEIPS